ncbi:MAG: transcription elongation factor GreA [Tidjanibacter sp.]|nr:transcription elongation factor GreA [Tidjanibacter sp.]MBR4063731.1 transcription elongation factor GreA [Tidjanibacter sp.]MBR6813713.1 transcription elongation factor GreA [Tidjanibacter sp.]MBR7102997.1 transcription elongation factor GreA [Tidjanibacter sp.]
METVYLTKDGYNKLKAELEYMRAVERPRAADAIAEARDKGDLSENAEYDAAKEAQRNLEAKIAQMEMTLANSRILDESRVDTSRVQILSRVHLRNVATKKEVTYTLVSDQEANLKEGKISVGTPIGKALIGHKKGETVDVVAPAGVMKFEILDISI